MGHRSARDRIIAFIDVVQASGFARDNNASTWNHVSRCYAQVVMLTHVLGRAVYFELYGYDHGPEIAGSVTVDARGSYGPAERLSVSGTDVDEILTELKRQWDQLELEGFWE